MAWLGIGLALVQQRIADRSRYGRVHRGSPLLNQERDDDRIDEQQQRR